MKRWVTKTMVAVACVLGVGGAATQQCVGFSDVDASSALQRRKFAGASMSKKAVKVSEFFQIPTNRVVALGTRVEL